MVIEDKELGLKVAVDPIEALWTQIAKEAESLIQQSKNNQIVQEAMLVLAKEKLKQYEGHGEKSKKTGR